MLFLYESLGAIWASASFSVQLIFDRYKPQIKFTRQILRWTCSTNFLHNLVAGFEG